MRTRPPRSRLRRSTLAVAALGITHGADGVTVSWNILENHFKGSLVGHSDNNAGEDTGRLKVTYHHNRFANAYSRMGAQLLVENNGFRSTKIAVTASRSSDVDGHANLRGNALGGAATEISRVGTFTSPPYGCSAEPASSVTASVTAGAGAGKL